MTDQPEKLDLYSHDIVGDNIQELLSLLPEIRTEGEKIDFDRLKLSLGEAVDVGKERYGMNWPGKADCFKTIQAPSMGTLLPCPEESIDFDTTENLIIEGDNLEVLKLLQKSYLGKVKMIYIDPPYNTGNDFIYPDDYTESLQTYLQYTGQVDSEGKKFGTNMESDGRFHSKWLNMMYPRLYLACNLLMEDGVIFVSINDREISQLRCILNDILGEENFVATLIWDKGHSAQAGIFKVYHEYILAYTKSPEVIGVPSAQNSDLFEAGAIKRESIRHHMQNFSFPAGVRVDAPDGTELTGSWGGVEKVELISGRFFVENGTTKFPITLRAAFTQRNQMEQYFYGNRDSLFDSRGQKIVEFFFTSTGKIKIVKKRSVYTPDTTLSDYGTQSNASNELADLFGLNEPPIDNPKPVKLISSLIQWFTQESDIVIDFFAGSGTTAHAILDQEYQHCNKRKFILVQLPEKLNPNKKEQKAAVDFCDSIGKPRNIAEICKERVRRVIKKLNGADTSKLDLDGANKKDRGFRVFKLAESNLKPWDAHGSQDAQALEKQLEMHVAHIREDRGIEDILYEILLKSGFPLTTPIEKLTLVDKTVHSVAGGALFICLEHDLTLELIRAMAEKKPERVVCLDQGFAGNDQLKANAVQIFKTKSITSFKTI